VSVDTDTKFPRDTLEYDLVENFTTVHLRVAAVKKS
jgi:hypothetical protein